MEGRAVNIIRWYLGYAWRRLGWELVACLALIGIAAVLTWQANNLVHENQSLRTSLSDLTVKPKPVLISNEPDDTARRLNEFYAQLPVQEDIAVEVKRLFSLAEKHGVTLALGEYRPTVDGAARVIKYQITLPVTGDINRVEGFVLDALKQIRTLGLEGVTFKRDSSMNRVVDAHLRFVLIVRTQ